jgi:YfiH family protein
MIRPPGWSGVLFGTAAEGDLRVDPAARSVFVGAGAPDSWAFVTQVHGAAVVEASAPGNLGEADALFTQVPGLALTVATADCIPIFVGGGGFAAVVHAGWRGLAVGVVPATLDALRRRGLNPTRAAMGPCIGACCYEVGDEVRDRFPGFMATTTWGSSSLDMRAVARAQLVGLEVWESDQCTMTDPSLVSYRRDRTSRRQVAVTWLPNG